MRKQIISIQYLRGIAALLVVFFHVFLDISKYNSDSFFLNFYDLRYFGQIGVDVFFVISGFIMMYIHGEDFQKNNITINFLKKRIIRVVPLYWILTTFTAVLLFFRPSIFGGGKAFDLYHVISSYLFIPAHNSIGLTMPILGPGWSLNYEMYFYILFSLFLLFPKKYFIGTISILFTTSIFCSLIPTDNPVINMVTNPMLFEFLFGIYIAFFFLKNKLQNYFLPLGLGVILLLVNIYIHLNLHYRVFFYGITSSLFVIGLLAYEQRIGFRKPNKVLMFLANISYSLYLSHVFSYKIILRIIPNHLITSYPDSVVIFTIIGSIIIGYVTHKLIEIPASKILKRLMFNKSEKSLKVQYQNK